MKIEQMKTAIINHLDDNYTINTKGLTFAHCKLDLVGVVDLNNPVSIVFNKAFYELTEQQSIRVISKNNIGVARYSLPA